MSDLGEQEEYYDNNLQRWLESQEKQQQSTTPNKNGVPFQQHISSPFVYGNNPTSSLVDPSNRSSPNNNQISPVVGKQGSTVQSKLKQFRKPLPSNQNTRQIAYDRAIGSGKMLRLIIKNKTGYTILNYVAESHNTYKKLVLVEPEKEFEYIIAPTELVGRDTINPVPTDENENDFFAHISLLIQFRDANGQPYDRPFTYVVALTEESVFRELEQTPQYAPYIILQASIITRQQKDSKDIQEAIKTQEEIVRGQVEDGGEQDDIYDKTIRTLEPLGKQEEVFGQKSMSFHFTKNYKKEFHYQPKSNHHHHQTATVKNWSQF